MKIITFDLNTFNASQREAICHQSGPALVLAGPGSGKTTVITKRLQYLTQVLRVPPDKILAVTFTKAAALELRRRSVILTESASQIRFGTFHAIFYQILRESSSNCLTLLTEAEKQQYIRSVLRRQQIDETLASAFLEAFASLKGGTVQRPGTVAQDCRRGSLALSGAGEGKVTGKSETAVTQEQVTAVFHRYRKLCQERNKLDFDDMTYECLNLLEQRPDVLQRWQDRCRYILADEYQDISPIQEKILLLLAKPEDNLFLVGDDDQSIYGFRGAGPERMLTFPERYPQTRQIALEANYRCRPGIIRAAGAVIAENTNRFVKTQTPARESVNDSEVICEEFSDQRTENQEVLRLLQCLRREGHLARTAVLFRRNGEADSLVRMLAESGVPYVRTGKKNSGRSDFIWEDLAAYVRLLLGERRRADFYQVMNRPDRQIDRESCQKETVCFRELLNGNADMNVMKNIRKLEADCERASRMRPFAALMYIRKEMGYEAWLQGAFQGEALEEALQMLMQIQEMAAAVKGLRELRDQLAEGPDRRAESGKIRKETKRDGVHILTYHGSKGLEFDYVILPGLNEGNVPHKKAENGKEMEEERRMFYVAMTRAREKLYLFYKTGTKKEPETMSRFLKAIVGDKHSAT